MPFYTIGVGDTPRVSDINQFIGGMNGTVDVGAISFVGPTTAPASAGSATNATGSELGIGTYKYAMTFVTGVAKSDGTLFVTGETTAGPEWTALTSSGFQRVSLTSLPNGGATVIGKRIYRTAVNGTQKMLVATLSATQPSYVDTLPDANLGANVPTTNTTGTTLTLAGDPTAPNQAVNKAYLDAQTQAARDYSDASASAAKQYSDDTADAAKAYSDTSINDLTTRYIMSY